METIEAVTSRIQTTEDLQSVVKTMKALAAVNIRHYERAAEALNEYSRTIELGLQAVLRESPAGSPQTKQAPQKRVGMVVFGSDQGMCGQLNDHVVRRMLEELRRFDEPPEAILAIGVRVAGQLEDVGHPAERSLPVPGSTSGIGWSVQEVLLHLDGWHTERGVDTVLLAFSRHESGASYHPEIQELLPVDRRMLEDIERKSWPTEMLPTFSMERNSLFSELIGQYLFVSIHRAFAESLASENASRLASMQNAEHNIEERLEELTSTYHRQRQMSVTEEILDIVSGFEALGGDVNRNDSAG